MARNKPQTIQYRRKREKKTDYKKRLHLLTSRRPRVVIRLTNTRLIAQLVQFQPAGDLVLVGVQSTSLRKFGWQYSCKNFPAAYLTGLLFAKKSVAAGFKEAILDTGLLTPLRKGKVYAFLRGVLDGGLQVPVGSDEIFPTEDMVQGKHVAVLGSKAKGNQFTQYLKTGVKPEGITAQFEKVKAQLQS
ncbi:50S ribosomal protein L18 [Candidatus Woesearchaeota archaeon]|jgi:large subunit ribosomal protein L18|nr:50S ribosomal protein L18 [Candidatus Woesearchaeota archaeon]MBT5739554.1 50S ribosomal protein L18 [Candidatus Woesearchaeota archaeon]